MELSYGRESGLLVASGIAGCPCEIELSDRDELGLLVVSFIVSCPFEIETVHDHDHNI